jgi:hypothetical protein
MINSGKEKAPKKIHFVWVGGPIKQKYLESILNLQSDLRKIDPEYEVTLWIDDKKNFSKTYNKLSDRNADIDSIPIKLKTLDELKDTFFTEQSTHVPKDEILPLSPVWNNEIKKNFPDFIKHLEKLVLELESKQDKKALYYRQILQDLNNDFVDNIESKQTRFEQFWEIVNKELIGFKNYGAASDMIRYAILYTEGGYYFDTDTEFQKINPEKFKTSKSNDEIENGILVHSDGQGYGNDIIISTQKNNIIKEIVDETLKNYLKSDAVQLKYERCFELLKDFISKDKLNPDQKKSIINLSNILDSGGTQDKRVTFEKKINYKRENYYAGVDILNKLPLRMAKTISTSGPNVLDNVINRNLDEKKIEKESFFIDDHIDNSSFRSEILPMFGNQIGVSSHSDLSWVGSKKPKEIKSFTDEELSKIPQDKKSDNSPKKKL